MPLPATLLTNLLSPIPLAFALGVIARLLKSELSLPKDLYASLSIYLLFALGLKGGVELSHASFDTVLLPVGATLLLGTITPLITYATMRYAGRFGAIDSAAMAAHYGSVSAVTFIAAQEFVQRVGTPAEGFMPTLLTLLESPGIHIALVTFGGRGDGARHHGRERQLHRRTARRAPHPSRSEPHLYTHRGAGHHLSLQHPRGDSAVSHHRDRVEPLRT
jgi:hypothetical protein